MLRQRPRLKKVDTVDLGPVLAVAPMMSPFVPLTPHRSGTDGPEPVHQRAREQALA